jgi:hypothetical protein
MTKRSILAALAAVATITTAAYAATFDTDTGLGFVGKGEVQTPFEWNNAALQANAEDVQFSYGTITTRAQECRDNVAENPGPPVWVYETSTATRSVGRVVDVDTRTNKKAAVTGFWLTGFVGGVVTTGSLVPECPAGYTPHGAVTVVRESQSLIASHGSMTTELQY